MFVTVFFNHGFEFQNCESLNFFCNRCHDLMILYLNQSDIAIITVITVGCYNGIFVILANLKQ